MLRMCRNTHSVALAGRILLSCIFLVSAYAKLSEWNSTLGMMEAKSLPAVPALLVVALLIEGLGGLSILTGFYARAGAWMLFLYLIPVTIVFHSFWDVGAAQQNIQLVSFLKNVSIMGGLLLLAANGPGRFSIGSERRFYDDVALDASRERSEIAGTRV